MTEPHGAQYALQIAVHTLRERCKALQQRVVLLEEENVGLRVQCNRYEDKEHSLNEVDELRERLTQLTEQKEQLSEKVKMVTSENQGLWNKLSKITKVNRSLGSQLNKISDTLVQHAGGTNATPITLIRSKTFTKNELQTKVLQKNLEENDKISLELEDISLKLSDSFSKQKKELDMMCRDMEEAQSSNDILKENCGFLYDDELEDGLIDDVKNASDDLKIMKDIVLSQRLVLMKNIKTITDLKEKLQSEPCQSKSELCDKFTSTVDLVKKHCEDKSTETEKVIDKPDTLKPEYHASSLEKICPLCSKNFQREVDFSIFQQHVEDHFVPDMESYVLY
ncbi:protein spindle-F [Cylas formicarius]|uniref:protein spindle-F n=1 Tax=Cylas formicarius TaxID=197179 RepID=UPI0029588A44|nr:protein spindle-F [Cylas formicarius]